MSRSFWGSDAALSLIGCGAPENQVKAQTQTDVFEQAKNNEVDILWVIDNSGSMAEEQAALADGFTAFASQLAPTGEFHRYRSQL